MLPKPHPILSPGNPFAEILRAAAKAREEKRQHRDTQAATAAAIARELIQRFTEPGRAGR